MTMENGREKEEGDGQERDQKNSNTSDTQAGSSPGSNSEKSNIPSSNPTSREPSPSASSPAQSSPSEPQELRQLPNDKKLDRLKFLVSQSKIYAGILKERLAPKSKDQDDSKSKSSKPSPRKPRAKNQKSILEFHAPVIKSDENKNKEEDVKSRDRISQLVKIKLKDYQLDGVEWLISLFENGLNGILADEMGLGKTLEAVALVAYLIDQGIAGPYLVVAPLSTIDNWTKEFNRSTPQLKVIKYYGTKQERSDIRMATQSTKSWHVMITSYDIIMRDAFFLRDLQWSYLIVDEGHRLKNMHCSLIKELKSFDTANRLLLTGTPLQNNLAELWSLLNFILPDVFTDLELFQQWFDTGAHDQGQEFTPEERNGLISSLHEILRPFLLRRLKKDVLKFLPPKREYTIYAGLSKQQVELYRELLKKKGREYIVNKILQLRGYKEGLFNLDENDDKPKPSRRSAKKRNYRELDEDDLGESEQDSEISHPEKVLSGKDEQTQLMIKQAINEARGKSLQNMVMQLRLAADSPYIFYFPWENGQKADDRLVTQSGKMLLLEQLSSELIKNGHKLLIFSQFTKMLDLIEEWILALHDNWRYCRIDGSTNQSDRQDQMESFNKDSSYKLFLLSTRSGGLGINLSSADTVILFDSDWNPQQDLQAMDRVHRIGQTRPVIVYRLATRGTIEENLLARADSKKQLEHVVIEEGKFRGFGLHARNEQEAINEIRNTFNTNLQKTQNKEEIEPYMYKMDDDDLRTVTDRSSKGYGEGGKAKSNRIVLTSNE